MWFDIGKPVCERVRARARARFYNCLTALVGFRSVNRSTAEAMRLSPRQYMQGFIPGNQPPPGLDGLDSASEVVLGVYLP